MPNRRGGRRAGAGRPRKDGKKHKSLEDFVSGLKDVSEEELSESDRAILDIADREEYEDWKITVRRVAPQTLPNGTPCTGYCYDFPIGYYENVESFISKFFKGGTYQIEIRKKGIIQKTGRFVVIGRPAIPNRDEIQEYYEKEESNMKGNPQTAGEREDMIRRIEELKTQMMMKDKDHETERLRSELTSQMDKIADKVADISKPQDNHNKASMTDEASKLITAIGAAFAPLLAPLAERLSNPPQQGNQELLARMDKLENDKYLQLLEKMSDNKKDPMMAVMMKAIMDKAFGENQSEKFFGEIMPQAFKQMNAMQKDAFKEILDMKESMGGPSGGDDGFSWKDVGGIVKDVLRPSPMPMLPPGMMPQQHQLQAPIPGVPSGYPPGQPQQGGQPQSGAGFQDKPQATPQANAEGEKSATTAGHKVNPAIGQMAAEFFQTGRSGERFAETIVAANTNGNLISPFLLDMIASADPAEAKKYIYDFVTNQPGPLSQQLAKDLKTAEGQKFLDEAIAYFKE
jgi:hypothetical protein